MTAIFIGLAGIFGAISRYGISLAMNPQSASTFPWGTLICNFAGCLLLGGLSSCQTLLRYPKWRAALTTGFIGSFTTFSTFSWEMFSLWEQGERAMAAVYFLLSVWGGLLFIRLGRSLKWPVEKRGSAE